jgi:hypothetical protein
MNDYQVGDFGKAKIITCKKGFSTCITCFGTIKEVSLKCLLFQDNDDFEYLVSKKDFEFEKHDKSHLLPQ